MHSVNRPLYLAAYDVVNPRRLQQALDVLKGYSTGGQKSVFECFLADSERRQMMIEIRAVLDLNEDKFLIAPAGDIGAIRTLGMAVAPDDPPFFYHG